MSLTKSARYLLFALSGTVLNCVTTSLGRAEESLPPQVDAQALVNGLVEWKDTFQNLRLVTRWTNPGQWIQRKPELAEPGALDGYYHTEDWLYSDDGRSRFEDRTYENGVLMAREFSGNDGKQQFSCKFQYLSDFPESIHINPIPGNYSPREGWKHPVRALHYSGKMWAGEAFHWQLCEMVRHEQVDGVWCAVVRPPTLAANVPEWERYFDLEHDGLIKIETHSTGYRLQIDEFRQINNDRWFPWKGSTLTSTRDTPYEWDVVEAKVNLTLTLADFAPPEPGPRTVYTGINPQAPVVQSPQTSMPAYQAVGIEYWLAGVGVLLLGLTVALSRSRRSRIDPHPKTEDTQEHPSLPKAVAIFTPWTWPRWNLWLLMGGPALLVIYVLSVGPVLRLQQVGWKSLTEVIYPFYYPLIAVSEELPLSYQEAIDRYCVRWWRAGGWRSMVSKYRSLEYVQQINVKASKPQGTILRSALCVGLLIVIWRRWTLARRQHFSCETKASWSGTTSSEK